MPSRDTIVFWQNTPSIHQAPLMRALAQRVEGRVVIVTEFDLPAARARMGWHRPDYGSATLVVAPSPAERERLEASLSGGVHIFSGLGHYRATTRSLFSIRDRSDNLVGIYAEPWDPVGWPGRLRPLRYRAAARRLFGRVDFLLTTGPLGRRQYLGLGFPATQLFPFGYFVDAHDRMDADVAAPRRSASVHLVFVGSLSKGKQPELLLTALSRCQGDWILDVVGDGPVRDRAVALASRLGIADRIRWQGRLSNAAARDHIAVSDILVLPSRYDGWGAVVNEALMAGTRTVVSDRCGAQDLAASDPQSQVFDASDVTSLARALRRAIGHGPLDEDERAVRAQWAATHISPDRGAGYLLDLVAHLLGDSPRPLPPWLKCVRVR